ncbi:hypothetical protein [Thomasclavelia spiroformis]|uniref:hypothetical protein n=1 Tax=Thomasclavelia spiroformis TaxID=29348 RepID=UPI0026DC0E89|nr:hypothetical protein [Thomasclavelia spiroformis]
MAKLNQAIITSLEQTGDYVLGEVVEAEVMPFDKGILQNESTYVNKENSKSGIVSIVSSTPYARRMYFHPEYNFQTKNNKNAKGRWLEDWTNKGKYADDVRRAYAYFLKKNGGL